ncbi:MAG: hypothetical protein JEZ11_04680 [Desulfobacterales bacterium]|nr:hypothetical protein [Desulfobacterales bacterium]
MNLTPPKITLPAFKLSIGLKPPSITLPSFALSFGLKPPAITLPAFALSFGLKPPAITLPSFALSFALKPPSIALPTVAFSLSLKPPSIPTLSLSFSQETPPVAGWTPPAPGTDVFFLTTVILLVAMANQRVRRWVGLAALAMATAALSLFDPLGAILTAASLLAVVAGLSAIKKRRNNPTAPLPSDTDQAVSI